MNVIKEKWDSKSRKWTTPGWDGHSCFECGSETEIMPEGTHYWLCPKCSRESFIDAIVSISVNTREEVEKVIELNSQTAQKGKEER